MLPEIELKASKIAMSMLERAHSGISGTKVGACIVAENMKGEINFFGGCNIELATSVVYHAERVAMTKAISEGYPIIKGCIVTSTSERQRAAMCGNCLQEYIYSVSSISDEADFDIVVLEPDGRVKLRTTGKERNGPLGYWGKGRLKLK